MSETNRKEAVADDYLKTLEEVKKQYEQYLEASELYKLSVNEEKKEQPVLYEPLKGQYPLTTSTPLIK